MDFIIRRCVRKMQCKERVEPIVKKVNKSILYPSEAHEVMNGLIPDLYPKLYVEHPNPLRVVKKNDAQDYYWLREYHGIQYAVKIGVKSELFITRSDGSKWYEEVPMSMTIEVPLKDCSRQTRENTTLFVSIFYDADDRSISLQTLSLRGIDIKDFPHDYWNISTVDCNGYPDTGCCGSMRYVRVSEFPEIDFGGLEIYDTIDLWIGSKTLKVFKKNDANYSIEQMLDYWKKFWKVCGY